MRAGCRNFSINSKSFRGCPYGVRARRALDACAIKEVTIMFESFLQDIRIGFRVLLKEKSFCFLAVLVLSLGICGVTTQFTIVNGLVLRGFSFPNPEQLMSVGLIDP